MGFLEKILGPNPDFIDHAEADRVRKELAELDKHQKELNFCSRPGDGTYERDNAAIEHKRSELKDQLEWATCSGKYKR